MLGLTDDTDRFADPPWIHVPEFMVVPPVPDAELGEWRVSHFEVDHHGAVMHNLRAVRDGDMDMAIRPGKYVRLSRGGTVVMSDTPMEMESNSEVVRKAQGTVLISGLDLGIVAHSIALKPEVERVHVLELSPEVISLVGPHVSKKIEITNADCFEYKPAKDERYDFVYHDIWDDISTDNLQEMGRLHRKWARRSGWQNSWMRDRLKYMKRRERSYGW